MFWRLHLAGRLKSAKVLDQSFQKSPSLVKVSVVTEITKGLPKKDYPSLAIVGVYIAEYEKRFYRSWKGNADDLRKLHAEVGLLRSQHGAEDACRAVEVIFSPAMKWLSSGHLRFLLGTSNFRDHIVPKIAEIKKVVGEPAEWSCESKRETGYKEVSI
jgi:hypothetical protein